MDDDALTAIIHHPDVHVHAVTNRSGTELGLLELDFREVGECELAFFGLVPEMTGRGHGKWLMQRALSLAWTDNIRRVHVHTCTLDHPAALDFYRSEEHTSELQSLMRISYAVFCLKKKNIKK